jgi:hypothetical protein
MQMITVSDEMSARIHEFRSVMRAVMDEDVDQATCIATILERGLQTMLANVVARAEHGVLLESIQQMATRDPKLVYGYVADMVALGSDVATHEGEHPIGF